MKIADKLTSQNIPLQAAGPRPPNLANVPIDNDIDPNKKPAPQGFLQKYWYIILPILIMNLFGGGGGDKGEKKEGEGAASAPAAETK